MYKISNHSKKAAAKLGVKILPSKRAGKKIDVFSKSGKKLASIGAKGYGDYASFKKKYGKDYAEKRRKAYIARHKKNIIKNTPGYYAAKILW